IFPHAVVDEANRPGWIVNVTNDAWFGTSIGPRQHFAITRTRAVEEGLPLVRAGNSGISAIIDPHGRVLARLDLGRRGVLEGVLPAALRQPTPYARHGDAIAAAMLLALLIAARLGFRRI
ncbi:nitrilase-related carbon-nitrogen hydrolase, partial [Leclercia adecarboxylata]|uniref:nitrilase-related carbon-nitrogen hydrolase n=1 Tax=Leclercia adecarboxylata TaxID=83655 RepID=UPI00236FE40F